jgi:hypothetical protein
MHILSLVSGKTQNKASSSSVCYHHVDRIIGLLKANLLCEAIRTSVHQDCNEG